MWHELQQEKARLKHQHEHFQEFMQGAFNEVRVFVVLHCALQCNLVMMSKKCSRVGVKIWDGIPQILKARPKKAFKRSLKATLLNILQTEDSYDYCENEKVIHLSFLLF